MVKNTVERETQPGPRSRDVKMEERATEVQRLIAAAREIVGGNDEDAAELISATASFARDRERPSSRMSEGECMLRELRRSVLGV